MCQCTAPGVSGLVVEVNGQAQGGRGGGVGGHRGVRRRARGGEGGGAEEKGTDQVRTLASHSKSVQAVFPSFLMETTVTTVTLHVTLQVPTA